jgi:dihydropyrimidinase
MNEFVAVTSTNIAKILNMYPQQGRDPRRRRCRPRRLGPEALQDDLRGQQSRSIDYNVFEGFKVNGLPRYTLTRGVVAIEESTVKTQEGHGKFVKREPFQAVNKALSTWKELTSPRKVERTGIPASGV